MAKLLFLVFLFVSAGLGLPAAAQTGTADVPPRPQPFHFVNDEASLMAPADAKKLESGLRRYADNNGTQIVVVTVPALGGRDVADYARAIGTAWGVGQRDKNNGVVVLVSAKDRKISIQPGSGLQSSITPAVTQQAISQMGPGFKQGNYFAGLRTGLNTLMAAADPNAVTRGQAGSTASSNAGTSTDINTPSNLSQDPAPVPPTDPVLAAPPAEPAPSGPGMGTLLIGALVIGGILWFVVRMFRNRSAAAANNPNTGPSGPTPDFLPNRGGSNRGPAGGNYNQGYNQGGPGYGNAPNQGGGGMMGGMGGVLATGAAAAAGAYLGNRMASGHDTSGHNYTNDNDNTNFNTGAAGAAGAGLGAAGTGAASDYFSNRDGGGAADSPGPDYFSDDNTTADNSSDYFSSDDNSSYDDSSSGDTGGGGFDSGDDNSGSW
ncbi:TPM domain-containing protein [Hymenobacter sp. BT523]|uniref:TPM domain-containing protein n=1 Tax=Hymenobacter sp. BT523 TaxID=2795725 RepID=UPI0018EA4EC7|nr:TPM domain-containing protein [Hymenobacter sp. BT523]MBJ6107914.1 TPM domain-containing protein [Hymenobacter sp. BT523]